MSQRILCRKERWCEEVGRKGGFTKMGEGEEGMVFQREGRHREVSDMWEEVLVSQDVVHYTGPSVVGEPSEPP
jgi:hypothetical protein